MITTYTLHITADSKKLLAIGIKFIDATLVDPFTKKIHYQNLMLVKLKQFFIHLRIAAQ